MLALTSERQRTSREHVLLRDLHLGWIVVESCVPATCDSAVVARPSDGGVWHAHSMDNALHLYATALLALLYSRVAGHILPATGF